MIGPYRPAMLPEIGGQRAGSESTACATAREAATYTQGRRPRRVVVTRRRASWGDLVTSPADLPQRVELLQAAEDGRLSDLPCPDCGHVTVAVRFTHPFPDEWRTWFLCRACTFEMRSPPSGKPTHFSEGLVDRTLEGRDRR